MHLDSSIITVAGAQTAAAGLAYAVEGRAKITEFDPDVGEIRGTCRGSGRTAYSTEAYLDSDRSGAIVYTGGGCSCPVGVDCKHSVALYLTMIANIPGIRRPAPAAQRAPAAPEWERTLGRIFVERPPTETMQVALGFEFGPATTGRLRRAGSARTPTGRQADWGTLKVRPLRVGKRGAWIQTGVSWRDFHYSAPASLPPAQARSLVALATYLAQIDYYGGGSGWHGLEVCTTMSPWQLLREVRDAGIPLVEASSGQAPIVIHDGSAEPTVDLVAVRDGVRLEAKVALPEGVQLADAMPIGREAIGVAGRDPDGTLTVVGFRTTAPTEWAAVLEAGGVRIPEADRERFERGMLPRIASRVGWRSSDRSFAPTPPPPPTLEVDVDLADDARAPVAVVVLGWRSGGERLPWLAADGDPTPRNTAAEQATAEPATAVMAALPALLDGDRARARTTLTGRDVATFVRDLVPQLQALPRVEVRMREDAPDFRDLGEPEVRVGLIPGTDWFDLDVAVSVGGASVPVADLISALARDEDTLFLADGGYVRLDSPELERLRALLEEARAFTDQRSNRLRVSRLQFSWWDELLALGVVEEQERAWIDALRAAATAPESAPPLPEGVRAELRPYQLEGYAWLARLRRAGLGGVLADDMGLGKTLQSLAMILDARREQPEAGPFVVVAPTSVVPNWSAEAARFTPELRVVPVTQMLARRGAPLAESVAGADVVVTSYALFRLEYEEYEALRPSGLLLDEAQNAKNHQSRAFACAKQLPAPVKFAVTGTPMENNLGELWAMFSIVAPGLLGSPKQFTDHYRGPIERGEAPEALDRLRRRIAPFLLRRTKDQVATDLPEKQEQRVDVELAPAHRRLYARQLQRERQRVLGLVEDLDRNRIEVLSALTRLRQLAIDPSLVSTDEVTAPSSKLDVLVPLLEEAASEGHRTLVFSQFTRFLDRIEPRLAAAGLDFVRLDGSTTRRGEVVRSFTEGTQPVFLISLKAGGTGLNLAMADYCILTDPWWNPATEAQAVDRAHRIGQNRPVVVYRLIAKDTIEEKVMALQEKKRALVSGVIGGEGGGAISASDILALLD